MQIFNAGQLNLSSLVVPDVYLQIIAPQVANLNGVPTNIVGYVGVASWGPVNAATQVGNPTQLQQKFGLPVNRKYDLVTHVSVAMLQQANNFQCVRVTDGTDAAATATVLDTAAAIGAHLTSIWTGTYGNNMQYTLTTGSTPTTFKLIIAQLGYQPEIYDNIGGAAGAFWTNLVNAVNNGNSPTRGPSQIAVATIGVSVVAPEIAPAGVAFSSGADGATTITGTVLVGTDGALGTRAGMYALRRTGCSIAALADCDLSTTWTTQLAFGNSEGIYMIMTGPAGQSPTTAVTALNTAGIAGPESSWNAKLMLGDWCFWADPVNQVTRLISPQPFVAGLLANTAPQGSSLNQQVFGLVGTQTSLQNQTYATSDLTTLGQAGIDLICNPVPGGSYFGVRFGRNLSTVQATNGDNYTRMTNYLAATIGAGMGQFIGGMNLQSIQPNDPYRAKVDATVSSFLTNMQAPIANPAAIDEFQVICDLTNNTPSTIGAGDCILNANVRYLAVVSNIVVNLQGGQTVQIVSITSTPA